ncbi:MAG: flagellar hook-basal body complex protein [Alphaproteobacteria bacterium]|nr:flagellar hook-basal body complex protein [Alphaproteobacteria bacterium]
MGLFGSLFTGVSALSAQSQKTAIISNNIANINTTGFKRSEAAFFSLVTTESGNARFSPGTVTANRLQQVSQQGPISQSTSSTDAAISGKGFFPVKRDSDDSSLTEYLYTRNGQFSEDSQGFLRNSAGFYLYGWPIDTSGNLPANQGDLTSLVPIDVAFLGGLTRPTNTAELSINLDAAEVDVDLSIASTTPPDFTRGLTVYDTLGNPQPLTFEFVKTYGPQATASSTRTTLTSTDEMVTDLGLADGNRFTISVDGGAARTYQITNTDGAPPPVGVDVMVFDVGDLINDINANVTNLTAFLGNEGEIVMQHDNFVTGTETFTIADTVGSALSSLGFTPGAFLSDDISTAGIYDNGTFADTPPYSTGAFPTLQFLPGAPNYNSRGWWTMTIRDPSNALLTTGLINFNGDGTINALPDISGHIDVELNQINWNNGSELQNILIDIERFSQFSSDYTVLFSDQDGAELGLRTGIEIDREGFIIAQFSNGASSVLYKLPLVTFANANGLQEVSGTAYTETEDSGEENLREAGSGGAGFIEPATLENSNVDLADEFALLIVAQRAYSAGTKIINTIDQMTQELLQLR